MAKTNPIPNSMPVNRNGWPRNMVLTLLTFGVAVGIAWGSTQVRLNHVEDQVTKEIARLTAVTLRLASTFGVDVSDLYKPD